MNTLLLVGIVMLVAGFAFYGTILIISVMSDENASNKEDSVIEDDDHLDGDLNQNYYVHGDLSRPVKMPERKLERDHHDNLVYASANSSGFDGYSHSSYGGGGSSYGGSCSGGGSSDSGGSSDCGGSSDSGSCC